VMGGVADLDRRAHLNFASFYVDSLGFAEGGAVQLGDGLLLWAAATEFPVMASGVMRLDDATPASTTLDLAQDFFAARTRGYTVFATSRTADADLEAACRDAFGAPLMDMPEMVCPARVEERPVADGAELRRVVDADGVRDFALMSAAAYATLGMPADEVPAWFDRPQGVLEPHLCTVLAYLDGEPVSGAMANLSHGIGGVYWVGTVPAARGHALADACTRFVTNWAFDEGARAVSLQASPQGEPIYRAMGYEDRFRYTGYLAPAPD
jgi:GNAT superfamily N-acetyltransferase